MKVIWRQPDGGWVIAQGHSYRNEAHLQDLLVESPYLIPFEDVSKDIPAPKVMIREFGLPGSGSSDIVGVDEQGGITIVECKLASNPEIKRKVIGQILEYAAFLWRKPYDELDRLAQHRLGRPLAKAMEDALDEESLSEWNQADFIRATAATLLTGEFQLVIAVDNMNDELQRTISYLSEGSSNVSLFVLEVEYFTGKGGEVLVPRLYGATRSAEGPVRPAPSETNWGTQTFFEDVEDRKLTEVVSQRLEALLAFTKSEATKVRWGRGAQVGSFTFHYIPSRLVYSVFSAYSDGTLAVNFGYMKDRVPNGVLAGLLDDLRPLPAFDVMTVRDGFKNWPKVRIEDAFADEQNLEAFQQAVVKFCAAISEVERATE